MFSTEVLEEYYDKISSIMSDKHISFNLVPTLRVSGIWYKWKNNVHYSLWSDSIFTDVGKINDARDFICHIKNKKSFSTEDGNERYGLFFQAAGIKMIGYMSADVSTFLRYGENGLDEIQYKWDNDCRMLVGVHFETNTARDNQLDLFERFFENAIIPLGRL